MKKVNKIPVEDFYQEMRKKLRLDLVAGEKGLKNLIKLAEVNRPGLALAGYFDYFARDRVQVLGKVQSTNVFGCQRQKRS